MTRIVVILVACLAACDVGDASNGKTGGGDGGVKMDGNGSGSSVDAAPAAAHVHTNPVSPGNTSNAGQGCLNANCHGSVTPAGPTFAFAGTVYTDSNRTAGAPGVTVTAGSLAPVITDTAGNFYTYSPPTLTLPCTTSAGAQAMSEQITTGGGNCNSSGCHQQPGGTQQGIYK